MDKNIVTPIKFDNDMVTILDQTRLPNEVVYIKLKNVEDVYDAIIKLKIRGAPAIGIAGAYGLFIVARNSKASIVEEMLDEIKSMGDYLISSRPTAVNLDWAIKRVISKLKVELFKSTKEVVALVLEEAQQIHMEDEETCFKIGKYGALLFKDVENILTHCNAGSIATAKYGTALSPIYYLKDKGKNIHVYADETRPLLQGARLTAWELKKAGIEVTLITDNMAGFVMAKKNIGAVIVGADRITANGDVANKIGTYSIAILAKEHKIPFYVAAPLSTFDIAIANGEGIPIEERDKNEVIFIGGKQFAPDDVDVYNPAFDVTPNKYITAIITEKGIIEPPFKINIKKHFV